MKGSKKNAIMDVATLILGAVVANVIQKQAAKFLPSVGKYAGAIPIVAGYLAASQKSPMLKMAGAGMIAAGGSSIIGSFLPMAAAPVSDEVLADAILTEEIEEDMSEEPNVLNDFREEMTEDMSEDMNGNQLEEDLTEDQN